MTYAEAMNRLETIRNLPICELGRRQPMLVSLIADVVNLETENGEITSDMPLKPLEVMPYWATLDDRLEDLGFTLLGNGHFSAAYSHGALPGRVIKVGFKKEDAGAAYAAFCRMNQGREGIPTVYDIQRHASCYTVVLDHLEALNNYAVDEPPHIEHHYNAVRAVIERGVDRYNDYPVSAEFISTCIDIREFFKGIASFDCHSGNMMKDSRGNLIVTDPVSFSCEELDSDEFLCDTDELMAEIEAMRIRGIVDRCKERKAKRDPNGTFRREQRAERKFKRAERKHMEKLRKRHNKSLDQRLMEIKQEQRNELKARILLGTAHWKNIFQDHMLRRDADGLMNLEAEAAEAARKEDWKRGLFGRQLLVDDYLDRKLQG